MSEIAEIKVKGHDPFGMVLVGRNWKVGGEYRYGFNGKESDSETYGSGNIYDYGFRIYNPRLGKFLSVDPLFRSFPWYTPYQFAGNKPIAYLDLDGLEDIWVNNTKYNPVNSEGTPILDLLTEEGVVVMYNNQPLSYSEIIGDFTNPAVNSTYNGLIIEDPEYVAISGTGYAPANMVAWWNTYNDPHTSAEERQLILNSIMDYTKNFHTATAIKIAESQAVQESASSGKNLVITWIGIQDPNSGEPLSNDDCGFEDENGYLNADLGEKTKSAGHEIFHWYTGIILKIRTPGDATKGGEDHGDLYGEIMRGQETSVTNKSVSYTFPGSVMDQLIKAIDGVLLTRQDKSAE